MSVTINFATGIASLTYPKVGVFSADGSQIWNNTTSAWVNVAGLANAAAWLALLAAATERALTDGTKTGDYYATFSNLETTENCNARLFENPATSTDVPVAIVNDVNGAALANLDVKVSSRLSQTDGETMSGFIDVLGTGVGVLVTDTCEIKTTAANTLARLDGTTAIDADAFAEMPAGGATAEEIWAADSRTLTGSAIATPANAQRSQTEIHYAVFQGGTRGLYCQVLDWSGDPITQAGITSITYTIYKLSATSPTERTAVENHEDITLDKTDVIFDTLQTDAWASDYNFRHILDVATNAAFATPGDYHVEFRITPTSGQVILVRFRMRAI